MFEKAISVSQFGTYVKNIFDAEVMLQGISVFGEISGFQIVRENAFFTLKDDIATVSCVMFGRASLEFKDGDSVTVTGSPNYYVKGGKLSFNVHKIEKTGVGILFENFIKLKQKLETEGLFDQKIKKEIPTQIKKVGLVTSKTGAVLHDIINVCTRRNPFISFVLYPVRVQGEGAEVQIAKGISYFENTDVDVVIVARGGGSQEDLFCFNTEVVARAGFGLSKPLISAVGHETNFTIIDFVADIRASTPSVAGELVAKDVVLQIDDLKTRYKILFRHLSSIILSQQEIIEFKKNNIRNKLLSIMSQRKFDLISNIGKLKQTIQKFLLQKEYVCSYNMLNIKKLNPKNILELGYAKVEQNGISIVSSKQLDDCEFDLIFKDATIVAKKISNEEK